MRVVFLVRGDGIETPYSIPNTRLPKTIDVPTDETGTPLPYGSLSRRVEIWETYDEEDEDGFVSPFNRPGYYFTGKLRLTANR